MKKKTINSAIVIFVAALSYFFLEKAPEISQKTKVIDPKIALTKHAICRMECRDIDMSEVKLALSDGKINQRKSEPNKKPCPVYAREVYSQKDKQRIRVVSADCKDRQTIITVIDLTRSHKCFCR